MSMLLLVPNGLPVFGFAVAAEQLPFIAGRSL